VENFNSLDLVAGGLAIAILIGAFLMMFSDFWTRKKR